MVAYSFNKQFIPPILAGTKPHTIRAERKRHARVGEDLQLYTAMRTTSCKLIALTVCLAVNPIQITFGASRGVVVGGKTQDDLDKFAISDGFASWLDMEAFWRATHNKFITVFSGVMIDWDVKKLHGGMVA